MAELLRGRLLPAFQGRARRQARYVRLFTLLSSYSGMDVIATVLGLHFQ
jgi:hypothetical protein